MNAKLDKQTRRLNPTRILQTILALRQSNLLKLDSSYFNEKISSLFHSYTHTAAIISPGVGKLHRSIKYSEKPLNVKDLKYPPREKAQLNRANSAGNPLFYCSGNPVATFFELGINAGNTVVLSKWTLKNEICLFPVGYSDAIFKKLGSYRQSHNYCS